MEETGIEHISGALDRVDMQWAMELSEEQFRALEGENPATIEAIARTRAGQICLSASAVIRRVGLGSLMDRDPKYLSREALDTDEGFIGECEVGVGAVQSLDKGTMTVFKETDSNGGMGLWQKAS